MSESRTPEYPINPVFLQRWSPRAFNNSETISDQALFSLFEAARWAPSGNNSQPWRFIYFKPDSANWQQVVELTNDNNRRWASNAGALLLLLSKTSHLRAGDTEPSPLRNHSLDAGAAWASLSLQAVHDGLITHAIGGFDREKARELLQIPEGYHIEIFIAVGKQAHRDSLPPDLHAREQPTPRKPVQEFVARDGFGFAG